MFTRLTLDRRTDPTGVSGTGLVAHGWELWPGGPAILHWDSGPYHTWVLHPGGLRSIVHIHGHQGQTTITLHHRVRFQRTRGLRRGSGHPPAVRRSIRRLARKSRDRLVLGR